MKHDYSGNLFYMWFEELPIGTNIMGLYEQLKPQSVRSCGCVLKYPIGLAAYVETL